MNLLNNLFDINEMEIKKINKRYLVVFIVMVLLLSLLLLINKDNYLYGSFTTSDSLVLLLVDENHINDVKANKKIMINNIQNSYSIKKIMLKDGVYVVSIKLDTIISNLENGEYKIYLGKEKLFEYIIRIIKNK